MKIKILKKKQSYKEEMNNKDEIKLQVILRSNVRNNVQLIIHVFEP